MPFVSVIIVTLNRRKKLEKCLKSLYNMDYPPSKFEVIVVDGDSVDGTKEMIRRYFPKVNLIVDKRKGIPFARNTGWKHAKGTLVAYTDDDCIVDLSWLRSLVSGFTSDKIAGVGGPVLYSHPEAMPGLFYETPVGPFSLGGRKRFLKPYENLITANLAIRIEIFKKIRFFESLIYNDSEDYEFCRSVMEAGYKLLYLPNAKVYHSIDPNKLRFSYLIRRAFFAGISLYIVERKRRSKGILIPKFLRAFLGGILDFFRGKRYRKNYGRSAHFFWFVRCFIAFLSSMLLIACSFDVKGQSQT